MAGLIVHEWIASIGGSEKVVEQFVRLFPEADLAVLWDDTEGRLSPRTRESWLARTPLRRSKALALPFQPVTWRNIRKESDYDWILVSSHLFAHHASVPGRRDLPKIVYAHTPARYIWEPDLDRRGSHAAVRVAASAFKRVDRLRAQEALSIAANSEFTQRRIERVWGRQAEVIYPPVQVERITAIEDWRDHLNAVDLATLSALPADFLLGASRFVSYKRLDAVIDAAVANSLPVVLAGGGPQEDELRDYARERGASLHVVPRPSDALLFCLYQQCIAYVFPAIEDFGIMPVEAMAAGARVIVPDEGGAAESVARLGGGAVVSDFSPAGWQEAVAEAIAVDISGLRERTMTFSEQAFGEAILRWTTSTIGAPA